MQWMRWIVDEVRLPGDVQHQQGSKKDSVPSHHLVTARAYAMPASRDTSGLAVTSSHPGPDATSFDSTPTSSSCRRRRSLDTALVDVLRTQVATPPTTA